MMNEFEKWLAKNHPNVNDFLIATYKEAWKAAIGWTNAECRKWVILHKNVYSNINRELLELEND